jgi:hypothetical protein
MRRLVVSVGVVFGLILIGGGPALAEPVPGAGESQAAPGKKVCKVTDERLDELSGIVATDDGFVVINDSAQQDSRKRVFFLDRKCKVVDTVAFRGNGPRDTEDLLLSPDGKTLWIADIGDNQRERGTIGLWTMPADGSEKPEIHRLAYPDGAHDAEAMLLTGDDTPVIVTKEVSQPAALYVPAAALKTDNDEGVALKKVGEVTVPPSDTPSNTLARLGKGTVDGGAVASGGGKVVLRTYTDALEWSVSGGDVLAALKKEPRVTPLPQEPQGEAITYSPDGKYFYTVSDMQGTGDEDNYILQYTPVAQVATKAAAGGADDGDKGSSSLLDKLGINSINDITYVVGGIGVLGAILVGAGIFGIMRARKRPPYEPAARGKGDGGPDPTDAATEFVAVGGTPSGSGVYGAKPGPYGGKAQQGGVYGGGGGRPPQVARPGPAGRPGGGGQPMRPGGGGEGQPMRPGGGGQPAGRPGAGGGQPMRPGGGGQQPGRPGQGGGRPGGGGGGGGGGVYGAPPPHPQGPSRGQGGGPAQRPSGSYGQEHGRPTPSARNRDYDYRGYGR